LPDNYADLIRYYTLSESDLSIIRQRRGATNRLGFAVLCYLRFPGTFLGVGATISSFLIFIIDKQNTRMLW